MTKTLLVILTMASALASEVHAHQYEITNNASIGGVNGMTGSWVKSASDVSNYFTLGGEVAYRREEKFPHWQLSLPINILLSENNSYEFYLGLKYNLDAADILNSYFVALRPGLRIAGATDFLINLEVGKRFKLTESVSYTPSIGGKYVVTSSNPTGSSVYITPVSLTIMLGLNGGK